MITIGSYYEYWKLHKKDLLNIKQFFTDKITPHSLERHPLFIVLDSTWASLSNTPRNSDISVFLKALMSNVNFINAPDRYKVSIMSAVAYQLKQIEEDWYEDTIADLYNAQFSTPESGKLESSILCYQPYMDELIGRINKLDNDAINAIHLYETLFPDFKALNRNMNFFELGKTFYINITSATGGKLNLKMNITRPSQSEMYNVYSQCYSMLLDAPEDYDMSLGYNNIRVTAMNDNPRCKPVIDKIYNLWNRKIKMSGHQPFLEVFTKLQNAYHCRKFEEEGIY